MPILLQDADLRVGRDYVTGTKVDQYHFCWCQL